jgi:hypothetical protein
MSIIRDRVARRMFTRMQYQDREELTLKWAAVALALTLIAAIVWMHLDF